MSISPTPPKVILNTIGGAQAPSQNDQWLDNVNPATGEVIGMVPESNQEDLNQALKSAKSAFDTWSKMGVDARAQCLFALSQAIEQNKDALAHLESLDTGKPFTRSREVEVPRAALNFSYFAKAATSMASSCFDSPTHLNYTLEQPLGIVACISPWNLPLYLLSWKIAPALITGNCVIAKPSELTPTSAMMLGQLAIESGFPPGVLNILHGSGQRIGQAIIESEAIQAISFTGGTQTGRHIAKTAGSQLKKATFELGGKNPFIVFASADLEQATTQAIRAAFSNQGQICLCGSRLLIEQSIYEPFKQLFLEKANALTVGCPFDTDTDLGSVISKPHFEKILAAIELAQKEGGKLLAGGQPASVKGPCQDGYFIEPTVFENLPNACQTNQQEIFGPVVSLQSFDSEQRALELANDSRYGLCASVWTQNLSQGHRVAKALDVGTVWLNSWMQRDLRVPFGGHKQSGIGQEGGLDSLHFFTQSKTICLPIESS